MAKLAPIFETFFKSDDNTIRDHKTSLSKQNADKCLKESFEGIYGSIDSIINGEDKLSCIMESFQNMVDGIDYYKNDEIDQIERLIVESIESFDNEKSLEDNALSLEYLFIKLEEEVEKCGAKLLLEEEDELYKNVENLESQIDEENMDQNPTESGFPDSDMENDLSMSNTPTSPANPGSEGEFSPEVAVDGTNADVNKIEEVSKYEEGFEEGRKSYNSLKADGHNPRKYSQNIAETRMADMPYASVEQWRRGFEEGVKFQEKVLRETKPELFENENEEK